MTSISVRCDGDADGGWTCHVTVCEGDVDISTHRVRVRPDELSRYAPGATDPDELVTASFGFLLDRESPGAILRTFNLSDIARYFPEYDTEFPARER